MTNKLLAVNYIHDNGFWCHAAIFARGHPQVIMLIVPLILTLNCKDTYAIRIATIVLAAVDFANPLYETSWCSNA